MLHIELRRIAGAQRDHDVVGTVLGNQFALEVADAGGHHGQRAVVKMKELTPQIGLADAQESDLTRAAGPLQESPLEGRLLLDLAQADLRRRAQPDRAVPERLQHVIRREFRPIGVGKRHLLLTRQRGKVGT